MSKRIVLVFTRIAASAAIATFASVVCATAKPVTTTADTNLRKAAGTHSEVLTLIPKGTTVEVGKCSNGWCQASLDGKDGYVIAQNVGMASARRAPRGPVPEDEEIVDEGYVPGPAYVAGPVYYGYGPYYGGIDTAGADGDIEAVGDGAGKNLHSVFERSGYRFA